MKHSIIHLRLLLCAPLFVLASCGAFRGAAGKPGVFIAAEWNAQALFDGRESGNEYGEYLEAAGWTPEKYAARITAVSRAIPRMVRGEPAPKKTKTPDLIGFAEIENAGVLEDLAGGALPGQGYCWAAFANLPGFSLGIGFLSRYPITEVRAHSITVGEDTAPRPVLEARVNPRGKPLVFLLCHWKSKLGDDNAAGAMRRSSARVARRRLGELKEAEPETPVIVMGDLNENHDEFFRRQPPILTALLPDDPGAAALAEAFAARNSAGFPSPDFLVLSGEKPPRSVYFTEDVEALYSPWYDELLDESSKGSYYYKDDWETIDHFLLSGALFTGAGWEYAGCRVLNHAPFASADGSPAVYVPRNGRGLSDHLPLLLYLFYSE
jgi:endonuclease/exonuclease/phosphatase family metal-dependent hydrolase